MRFLKTAAVALLAMFGAAAVLAQSGTESRWHNSVMSVLQLQLGGTLVTSTADEINRATDVSGRQVAAGATLSITQAAHDGKTILLDQASGSAATLPAATGSGARIKVIVSTTVTSNSHTIACAGTDEFAGAVYQVDTDTSDAIAAYPALAADNFDVITMNGTTTGGLIGDWYELEDVASGVWALVGYQNASGAVATPLSAS